MSKDSVIVVLYFQNMNAVFVIFSYFILGFSFAFSLFYFGLFSCLLKNSIPVLIDILGNM
jgi:hypothetical protein